MANEISIFHQIRYWIVCRVKYLMWKFLGIKGTYCNCLKTSFFKERFILIIKPTALPTTSELMATNDSSDGNSTFIDAQEFRRLQFCIKTIEKVAKGFTRLWSMVGGGGRASQQCLNRFFKTRFFL